LQLLFLLTPIMWMPESVRGKAVSFLLDFNPFYYLLVIVREPLLGHPPDVFIWLIAGAISLTSFLAGHVLYGRFRHRVAYWL
jgi:ABC-type polysaccharide/polyol phosphate export permease